MPKYYRRSRSRSRSRSYPRRRNNQDQRQTEYDRNHYQNRPSRRQPKIQIDFGFKRRQNTTTRNNYHHPSKHSYSSSSSSSSSSSRSSSSDSRSRGRKNSRERYSRYRDRNFQKDSYNHREQNKYPPRNNDHYSSRNNQYEKSSYHPEKRYQPSRPPPNNSKIQINFQEKSFPKPPNFSYNNNNYTNNRQYKKDYRNDQRITQYKPYNRRNQQSYSNSYQQPFDKTQNRISSIHQNKPNFQNLRNIQEEQIKGPMEMKSENFSLQPIIQKISAVMQEQSIYRDKQIKNNYSQPIKAHFIKRIDIPQPPVIVQHKKQKVDKFTELMTEAKQNLTTLSLKPNFLILDSFKTMDKIKAETLDSELLNSLKCGLEEYKEEKEKVFSSQIIISDNIESPWVKLPEQQSEAYKKINNSLQKLRISTAGLNQMFRQLLLTD